MKAKTMLMGAVTLLTVTSLAACASNNEISSPNKDMDKQLTAKSLKGNDIVTYKGGSITIREFYETVKSNQQAQNVLLQMLINDTTEKEYGSKVTDKDIQEAYDETKNQYGEEAFKQQLAQAGLTEDEFKQQIRTTKLVEYAVKAQAEKELTDEELKKAYDNYKPEATAQIIVMSDKSKAEEVLSKAKEGSDFTQLAKDNTLDTKAKESGGKVTFDSTSTDVPSDVQNAIYALNNGQVGAQLVSITNYQTNTSLYYIVKLDKKAEKSKDMNDYKDILTKSIIKAKQSDTQYVAKVVGNLFKEYNVKVKDDSFQQTINKYVEAVASNASSSSSK